MKTLADLFAFVEGAPNITVHQRALLRMSLLRLATRGAHGVVEMTCFVQVLHRLMQDKSYARFAAHILGGGEASSMDDMGELERLPPDQAPPLPPNATAIDCLDRVLLMAYDKQADATLFHLAEDIRKQLESSDE